MEQKAILVIEDNVGIAHALKTLFQLEMPDVVVELARDGQMGLEMLRAKRYDLYLVDLLMPRLDGIDLLKITKADPILALVPYIIISANTSGLIRKEIPEGSTLVKKPFVEIEILLTAVKRALGI